MSERKTALGHGMALITTLIWGTTFISTKVLLRSFGPVEILFLRFLMGYLALWLISPRLMKLHNRKEELYFAAAGISGVTLYFLFENIALTYTLASNVGIIISIAPFFTAIMNYLFLHGEKPGARFFIGFAAAMAGISLISLRGAGGLKINPTGDFLAVLAAVVWAVYSTLTKKIGGFGYQTIPMTRRIFCYGLVFMIPALQVLEFHPDLSLFADPKNLFNIIFLGMGASAACFVTWNKAVDILGTVKTSVYIYLVPVVTVVTSAIVLGEQITAVVLAGMVLTLAGLFLSESGHGAQRKTKSKHEWFPVNENPLNEK